MRFGIVLLAVVIAIAEFGCFSAAELHSVAAGEKSAKGSVFAPVSISKSEAVVYFFRPKQFSGKAAQIFMSIPEEANNCYALSDNGYHAHIANPGNLTVLAAIYRKQKNFSMNLKPGDKRFVKVSFGTWGSPDFAEVPESMALEMIGECMKISACK